MFDAVKIHDEVVEWIKDYFDKSGSNSPCIIGISGGKDSTVTGALCVEALGKDRVFGVLMPDGQARDFELSKKICDAFGIKHLVYNIGSVTAAQLQIFKNLPYKDFKVPNEVVKFNNPARIRMATLYMIANQIGGRVANTCNMSETYVGYDTAWGDQAGDFAPIQNLTVTEVRAVGVAAGLSEALVNKTPDDGMCGMSDEDRFGFTYATLDDYLRGGVIPDEIQARIEKMHSRAAFKNERVCIPAYPYFPKGSRILK